MDKLKTKIKKQQKFIHDFCKNRSCKNLESFNVYLNKKEILSAYWASFKK